MNNHVTCFKRALIALMAAAVLIDAGATAVRAADDKEWSVEVGSGALFSNVRRSGLDGYTLAPAELTAALKLDEYSPDVKCLTGDLEFLFRGYGMAVVDGPESRLVGASFGPRYEFVQEGWKLVPYAEVLVGFGFADSRHRYASDGEQQGLGQDFNFLVGGAVGVRYDINETWYLRLAAEYAHFSNAGLSEPKRMNRSIDGFGPELSVGCRF